MVHKILEGTLKPAAVGLVSPSIGFGLIWLALHFTPLDLDDPMPKPLQLLLLLLLSRSLIWTVILTSTLTLVLLLGLDQKKRGTLPGWVAPWIPPAARALRGTLVGITGFAGGTSIAVTIFSSLLPEIPLTPFPIAATILYPTLPVLVGIAINLLAEPVLDEKRYKPDVHWLNRDGAARP